MRNNTLPRLVSKDVPTVQMLLWDLFHDADEENEDEDHTKLKVNITELEKVYKLEKFTSKQSTLS